MCVSYGYGGRGLRRTGGLWTVVDVGTWAQRLVRQDSSRIQEAGRRVSAWLTVAYPVALGVG